MVYSWMNKVLCEISVWFWTGIEGREFVLYIRDGLRPIVFEYYVYLSVNEILYQNVSWLGVKWYNISRNTCLPVILVEIEILCHNVKTTGLLFQFWNGGKTAQNQNYCIHHMMSYIMAYYHSKPQCMVQKQMGLLFQF